MKKILTVLFALLMTAMFGCGKKSEGSVTVSGDGKTAQYEVKTKEGKTTIAASDTQVSIPNTFPKDVPILKGAVPKMTMTQGKTEVLHLEVPGSVSDVAKDYQDKLKSEGWEIESSMNMGESAMVQAKKEKRQCAVVVTKQDKGTMVQLSVSQE